MNGFLNSSPRYAPDVNRLPPPWLEELPDAESWEEWGEDDDVFDIHIEDGEEEYN